MITKKQFETIRDQWTLRDARNAWEEGFRWGLTQAIKEMEKSEDGDWDFLYWRLKNLYDELLR